MNIILEYYTLLIMLITLTVNTKCDSSFQQCISQIRNKYFHTKTIQMYHWKNNTIIKKSRNLEPYIGNVDQIWSQEISTLRFNQFYNKKFENYGNRYKIISDVIIDIRNSTNCSLNSLLKNSQHFWNSRSKILIILNRNTTKYVLNEIWRLKRAENSVAMLLSNDTTYFYTFFPYIKNECRCVGNVRLLDVCYKGIFKNGADLFPTKIRKNLHECELRITTDFDQNTSKPTFAIVSTVEKTILETIGRFFNMTISLKYSKQGESIYNRRNENGTVTGGFSELLNEKTDIIYGLLMFNEARHELSEFLHSHMMDRLVWVYPTPRPGPKWKNIFKVFTENLWVVIFVTFLLISFTIRIIARTINDKNYYTSFSNVIFTIWQQWINGTLPNQPNKKTLKILLLFVAVYNLHINSAYSSFLITMLTSPKPEKMFESVHDLLDEDLNCYLLSGFTSIYNKSDFEVWKRILKPNKYKIIIGTGPAYKTVALERNSFLLASELVTRLMINELRDAYGNSEIDFLKEPFLYGAVVFFVSPGNPLKESFDRKITQLVESGLVGKWLQEVNKFYEAKSIFRDSKTVLKLRHLEGVFCIYFCGVFVSLFVLVVELYWVYYTK